MIPITVKQLKSVNTIKEKKWMYNLAAKAIQLYTEGKSIEVLYRTVNTYYNQHYLNRYTNIYRNKTRKEREVYCVRTNRGTPQKLAYARKMQQKYRDGYHAWLEMQK